MTTSKFNRLVVGRVFRIVEQFKWSMRFHGDDERMELRVTAEVPGALKAWRGECNPAPLGAALGARVEAVGTNPALVVVMTAKAWHCGHYLDDEESLKAALREFNQIRRAALPCVEVVKLEEPEELVVETRYDPVWVSSRLALEVPVDRKVYCHLSPIPPELTAPTGTMGCRRQRNRTFLAEEVCCA